MAIRREYHDMVSSRHEPLLSEPAAVAYITGYNYLRFGVPGYFPKRPFNVSG